MTRKCNATFRISALMMLMINGNRSNAQLIFNFNAASGTPSNVITGFQTAAARWTNVFTDSMTVNINISFPSLGASILGSTSTSESNYSYSAVKSALLADRKSTDDLTAVSHLASGIGVPMLINRTSDNPNGSGSSTVYLDNDNSNNNNFLYLTSANAKSIGLLSPVAPAADANISFSSNFTWDFDPTDGISSGAYDFVGVATHEIGHALGFISGVDILDGNSPPNGGPFSASQFTFVSTLDLFRYSARSVTAGTSVIDWAADNTDKYFSINGGQTFGAQFSTGMNFGDGRQASHWKDNLGLGIMDPTAAPGELLSVSSNDIQAFDVIGYDLRSSVPEPGAFAVIIIGMAVSGGYWRRRRGGTA